MVSHVTNCRGICCSILCDPAIDPMGIKVCWIVWNWSPRVVVCASCTLTKQQGAGPGVAAEPWLRYKLNQNEHYAEEDVHDEKYEQRHTLNLGIVKIGWLQKIFEIPWRCHFNLLTVKGVGLSLLAKRCLHCFGLSHPSSFPDCSPKNLKNILQNQLTTIP